MNQIVGKKDRLYVTLYARGGPGYHWALTRSPKHEDPSSGSESTRYHAHNIPGAGGVIWEYEIREIRSAPTNNTLVRLHLGKIEPNNVERMEEISANVEVIQGDNDWTCMSWVQSAVGDLGRARIIRRWNWTEVEAKAVWFVEKKTEEGRFDEGYDPDVVPTYDLIANKEIED